MRECDRLKEDLFHLMTAILSTEPAEGPTLILNTLREAMGWMADEVEERAG